jgi:FMN reductase
MSQKPLIVGMGGTTRSGSTSERALLAALARAQELGCDTLAFGAGQLPTEPYDPSQPQRSPQALALVDALKRADGVIWVSPSYHGGVSGLMKNAIDFVEDLRTDTRVYLQGRAVGSIVCADGPQAMGSTLAALRATVHALRGWPTPFGAAINSSTRPFGADGQPADPAALQACHLVADEVVMFARLVLAGAAAATVVA